MMFEQVSKGHAVFNDQGGDRVTIPEGDARPQLARARFLLDLNAAKRADLLAADFRPSNWVGKRL